MDDQKGADAVTDGEKKKADKLVSVIVPIYNEELWIDRCVQSILRQSYENMEVLLINDGSTDRTEEICRKITDTRVSYFYISNRGAAEARNYGLAKAAGEYILFVDGDDYIHRDMIKTLAAAMEQSGADIAKCRYAAVFADGRAGYSSNLTETVVYDFRQAFDEMNYSRTIMPSVGDALFKRGLLEGITFPAHVRIGEDYTFLAKVMMRAKRVVAVPDVLYFYSQNGDSVTHQGYTKESYRILENYIDIYRFISREHPELEKGAYAYLILQEMAIIVSMIKAERYDSVMIEKIKSNVRHGLRKYLSDRMIPLYLKGCAVLISICPGFFIFLYRHIFKRSRDMQTIRRAKETCA